MYCSTGVEHRGSIDYGKMEFANDASTGANLLPMYGLCVDNARSTEADNAFPLLHGCTAALTVMNEIDHCTTLGQRSARGITH